MEKIINKLNNSDIDIITYIQQFKKKELENIIEYSADKYYNTSKSIINDDIYDLLIDLLKNKYPNSKILENIGAKNKNNKVKLDYWLGSMKKIKPDVELNESKDLNSWIKNYKPPYNISDKLDGVSALIIYNNNTIKMFTRGDGNNGKDISDLLKYLSIPNYNKIYDYCKTNKIVGNKNLIAMRGELLIKKDIYSKNWSNKFKNERSTVSGLVNSIHFNPKLAKNIDLVLYEIVDPIFKINEQFTILKNLNFNVVNNITTLNEKLNINYLSELLDNRRNNSLYQIDGIIITSTIKYIRNNSGNPDYAFAYKDIIEDQIAITTVESVEWNISKDGYIIPTIILKPVTISGIIIKRTTGFNAKFIVDNVIGFGSEVEIIRSGDVIPYVKKVLKSSKSGKPDLPKIKWHWNETKVDIQIDDLESNEDLIIKNLYFFFSTLKTKGLGEKNIEKIFLAGYDTIEKILKASKNDLLTVENFGEKTVDNIYNSIKKSINNISLVKLMAASNKLGHGIGEEKIKQILQYYPNIITDYKKWSYQEFIDKLKELNGWEDKTSTLFVSNFDSFINFYNSIKKYITIENNKKKVIKGFFTNKIIVLSRFRDKDLQNKLEKQGAKLNMTVSKNTDYLVIKNKTILDNPTEKINKAKELNVTIITKDKLISML
uniref:DNA ligase (NAD(+)) n=1 Tax=viral metagenome TaxID=1070528 RepID=A0A6C0ED57_9ZZZZ